VKLLFLDTETTGTNEAINGVIQLAALMEVDGEVVGSFETLVQPWNGCQIAEGALEVSGITIQQLLTAPPEDYAVSTFIKWLRKYIGQFDKKDKAFLVGFNTPFDDKFLRALCDRVGEKFLGSYKWPDTIDVRGFAAYHLAEERPHMSQFRLSDVAAKVLTEGELIEAMAGESFHSAMADIRVTRAVWNKVRPIGRWAR
jgi:DNA polymerase III epsilon subunit-like protein